MRFSTLILLLCAGWRVVEGDDGPVCRPGGARLDCGYYGIQKETCEQKGCCWSPVQIRGEQQHSSNGIPWCFYREENSGYVLKIREKTDSGFTAKLALQESSQTQLGKDLAELKLTVDYETENRLHVKIGDVAGERYEVSEKILPRPSAPTKAPSPWDQLYEIQVIDSPFGFKVIRKADKEVLFDTTDQRFVFKEQYIEITSAIPEDAALYGLGESTKSAGLRLQRKGQPITLWARDQPATSPDVNLYGSHPILYDVRKGGKTHGVFLLNSNGMDIVLGKETITYRIIGGILDFYFFLGPLPGDVLKQYQAVIGKPAMPPFWSLGFHQCRYGYKDIEEVDGVVDRYLENKIPLEVMWWDIDYMDGYRDFSLDKERFSLPKTQAFLKKLRSRGQKWVPITDPGIKIDRGYPAYDNGLSADVFLKDASGKPYVGVVWPGQVHFVDYHHPEAQEYWTNQFKTFHDNLADFDGIWIDMNEPSNFCQAPGSKQNSLAANGCPRIQLSKTLETPPYAINNGAYQAPLSDKTIPVSIKHVDGSTLYDTHNLFGFAESIATRAAVQAVKKKRPFVLSRSTFPGSGSYVAHWSGDNAADWNNLRWGTVSILNSNLFGIPFTGADICGFFGATNEELCARWISVGAFYPFSRDHSDHQPQELYLWPQVANAAKKALKLRYQLLPYLYSAFYSAHKEGGAVALPLWMQFSNDKNTHNIDTQFLFGSNMLVSPVVDQGANSVRAYFPQGRWYDIWTHEMIEGSKFVTLDAPLGTIPVHIRGGSIIPMQSYHLTTDEVKSSPLKLVVALSDPQQLLQAATGLLYMDSGDSILVDGEDSTLISFQGAVRWGNGEVTITESLIKTDEELILDEVLILGVNCAAGVSEVSSRGSQVDMEQVEHDIQKRSIRITGLESGLENGSILSWRCSVVTID